MNDKCMCDWCKQPVLESRQQESAYSYDMLCPACYEESAKRETERVAAMMGCEHSYFPLIFLGGRTEDICAKCGHVKGDEPC